MARTPDDGPSGRMMRKPGRLLLALVFAIVLPLAAFAQGLPAAEPERLGLSAERLERIAPALRNDIAAGLIPGAVLLIPPPANIACFARFGIGDRTGNAHMTPDPIC